MMEKYINYLQSPTFDNFVSLRDDVISTVGFNPYSSELDDTNTRMEDDDYEGLIQNTMENLLPNHLISPGAHLNLAFAYHKLGQKDAADMEMFIKDLLLQGISQSGDGTETKPYLVSRMSDERDYLFEHDLTLVSQALIERNGRDYDVITTKEREDIWFDITDIKRILDISLGI
jgi:hypothetical protein